MDTELTLMRKPSTGDHTHGDLYMDGAWQCYTLEDVVRAEKIYGKTAIPFGRYQMIINWSNRFKRQLPRLLNVPNFDGILIHQGNTAADTHGCILVGETRQGDSVGNSRNAFATLFVKLEAASKRGKIYITITQEDS